MNIKLNSSIKKMITDTIDNMIEMKIRHYMFFIMALILSSSCAPSRYAITTTPEYEKQISKIDYINIINDTYLTVDPLFIKDYGSINDSKQAEAYILSEAKKQLEGKGYKVSSCFSPMVGGFVSSDQSYKVANSRKAEKKEMTPPFYLNSLLYGDIEYSNSLTKVNTQVLNAIIEKKTNLLELNDSISESLEMIYERSENEMILIILGSGEIVPTGKSLAQGFTVGVLTSIVTLGMMTYLLYDVSFLDTYIALLNLKTGELIWSNTIRLSSNPTKQKFYEKYWAKNLFYYFPEKE